ncbi:MAG: MBL fold metallo-hydrolase [Prevotellaceae bacterium]|nr:MBL fold metallo-hydrolase [Prevotellaceae bacterium]
MRLTYIFHSCFVLETEKSILLFDYWQDPSHGISRFLINDKPLYVFASHFHEDHFNKEIFTWKKQKHNITYILSKDILRHKRANKEDADVWLAKGGTWTDGTVSVRATGSTDIGVSWIVETEGKRIFHAGDLNNWYAKFLPNAKHGETIHSEEMDEDIDPIAHEKQYLGELKDIRKITDRFDIAIFPVDGRIGNGYTLGARQFIERFDVRLFVPMHFVASGFESAWRFKEYADIKDVQFWDINKEGECINVLQ